MRFRKAFLASIALGTLAIGGCANQDAYYGAVKAQLEARSSESVARYQAETERWKAVSAVAPRLDASGAAAATALAFAEIGGRTAATASAEVVIAPPKSPWENAWTAALAVADLGLRAYGIKVGGDVAIRQSDNQANTAIASYGAFSTMGGQIRDAGTAGYQYVQAPTSYTLSGTGVLGSGTYTGPVTTTTNRTCNGGSAAAGGAGGAGGGTTAGAQGGAAGSGGGAAGGTC